MENKYMILLHTVAVFNLIATDIWTNALKVRELRIQMDTFHLQVFQSTRAQAPCVDVPTASSQREPLGELHFANHLKNKCNHRASTFPGVMGALKPFYKVDEFSCTPFPNTQEISLNFPLYCAILSAFQILENKTSVGL